MTEEGNVVLVKSSGSGSNRSKFRSRLSSYRLCDPGQVSKLLQASVAFLVNAKNNSTYLLCKMLSSIKLDHTCLVPSEFPITLTIIYNESYDYLG